MTISRTGNPGLNAYELAVQRGETRTYEEWSPERITVDGLTVTVKPFAIGGRSYAGSSVSIVSAGTWYVAVDLFSGAAISLPRLGHRGCIPMAQIVSDGSTITDIDEYKPVSPVSRIPRAMAKINAGETLNVITMGSSLTEGSTTGEWPGMVFGGGSISDYRIPAQVTLRNFGRSGSPNQYQLAQTGIASAHSGQIHIDSGWPLIITDSQPPNGRSGVLAEADLVVFGGLANGGDYRLECFEPIVRNLRKMGIEVLLTTDNPQGYPFADYATAKASALYKDGPTVKSIADRYGCEFADTAAYVLDAAIRYPDAIYEDHIHMLEGLPNGGTGTPSGGHEVYARAIRSVFPFVNVAAENVSEDFTTGGGAFEAYSTTTTVSVENNRLKIEKNAATDANWGVVIPLSDLGVGSLVDISFDYHSVFGGKTNDIQYGLIGGGTGWNSDDPITYSVGGTVTNTLVAERASTDTQLLILGRQSDGAAGIGFYLDNITITITSDSLTRTETITEDFASDVGGMTAYGNASVTQNSGQLQIEKTSSDSGLWGAEIALSNLKAGDTVNVSFDWVSVYGGKINQIQVGVLSGDVFNSDDPISYVPGAINHTFTAIEDSDDSALFISGRESNGAAGIGFIIDNLNIVTTLQTSVPIEQTIEDFTEQSIPNSRIVTDTQIPGDAFVILPADELFVRTNLAERGTLGSHPSGEESFARKFSDLVGESEDMLTVTVGERFSIAAQGVVGYSFIDRPGSGTNGYTYEVWQANALQKTVVVPDGQPESEQYRTIYTPTELAKGNTLPNNDSIEIRVTAGTINICALIALTAELDYVSPEEIEFIGTWVGPVTGGSPNMTGYATDTADDYAFLRCPKNAQRVAWLLTNKADSKNVSTWSGKMRTLDESQVGASHVRTRGNHIGPGEKHVLKLTENHGGDSNYALHVGGAIIVYDR